MFSAKRKKKKGSEIQGPLSPRADTRLPSPPKDDLRKIARALSTYKEHLGRIKADAKPPNPNK